MPIICPTVTAYDTHDYRVQMERVAQFCERVHIDLMDGHFAPTVSPLLQQIWWPEGLLADIHLMYEQPMDYIDELITIHPNMVIIHNEATVHHMLFAARLHEAGILTGLAILHDTPIEYAYQIMHSFDQVLLFSGKLGHTGGQADLELLKKVEKVRVHHPSAEIAWDGGINDHNVAQLAGRGVDVFDVGGYIANDDDPQQAYAKLETLVRQ